MDRPLLDQGQSRSQSKDTLTLTGPFTRALFVCASNVNALTPARPRVHGVKHMSKQVIGSRLNDVEPVAPLTALRNGHSTRTLSVLQDTVSVLVAGNTDHLIRADLLEIQALIDSVKKIVTDY